MKTSRTLAIMLLGAALCAGPAMAQRGGGGHSSSSGSRGGSSMSSSSSRSSGSSFSSSSSRSSSSGSSRSYSSSSSSRGSSSSSTRSYSPSSSRSSSSSYDRSSSSSSRSGSYSSPRSSSSSRSGSSVGSRSESPRSGAPRDGSYSSPSSRNRHSSGDTYTRPGHSRSGSVPDKGSSPRVKDGSSRAPGAVGRPTDSYARPGRPGGVMPPADRPMRPAPYFHHPIHHHYVHCHPIYWDPIPPRPWYWPGFWVYCNSYWYDYHVTDVVVVRDYVRRTYNVDMIDYAMTEDLMYCLVEDRGDVYLQIYDRSDKLLAEQRVNRKYCRVAVDSENGGCWIMKKKDKDPLLFIYAQGELLIYEAD